MTQNQKDIEQTLRPVVPLLVWQGLNAVRLSGLTNMLDRPMVARIAEELGYPDAARWILQNPEKFATGIFRGFDTDQLVKNPGTDKDRGKRAI